MVEPARRRAASATCGPGGLRRAWDDDEIGRGGAGRFGRGWRRETGSRGPRIRCGGGRRSCDGRGDGGGAVMAGLQAVPVPESLPRPTTLRRKKGNHSAPKKGQPLCAEKRATTLRRKKGSHSAPKKRRTEKALVTGRQSRRRSQAQWQLCRPAMKASHHRDESESL